MRDKYLNCVWNPPRSLLAILPVLVFVLLTSCTRSAVPIPTLTAETTVSPTVPTISEPTATEQVGLPLANPSGPRFAVVWVPAEETLPIRQPAGISGSIVEAFSQDQRDLLLTGKTSNMGSSVWVEVFRPSGSTGWVNGWNLTETVAADEFCQDENVTRLLQSFQQSILAKDGEALGPLIGEQRGLVIRHDWWNPDVILESRFVPALFTSPNEIVWGLRAGSETEIKGSFRDVMLPQLEDVFTINPEVSCNDLIAGSSGQLIRWPSELRNLNFYSFHRPASESGSDYDWRTWAVGIEYIDGQPYIAVLILFRGEI